MKSMHPTNVSKIEGIEHRAARWVTNDYSSYCSVTQMINTLVVVVVVVLGVYVPQTAKVIRGRDLGLCLFIILSVQFGLLSGHLLGNSCPLG